MFTRLAISVNCDHNWFTSSYGPPNRRTSNSDDTFATTGNVASGAPDASTIKSSEKGYQKTSKDLLFLPLQVNFAKGVSFKFQNLQARSLQSQSLVTGKMLHLLIVSQDLMKAMRQHRDSLTTDPTIEIARFASCIGSPSDEELTHFVRPHTFFILNVRFDHTRRRE